MKPAYITALMFATALAWSVPGAEASQLVSEEEVRMYQSMVVPTSESLPSDDPGAPRIVIFQPDVDKSVRSPFQIEVFFRPNDGQRIAWDSFRVYYGTFQFDITNRILPIAKIHDNSIFISHAEIPAGKHRLTLKIADEKQRVSRRDVEIVVRN